MTVTDLTAAAVPTEAVPAAGPGRITVSVEGLLNALDTVEPQSGGQLPSLAGVWMCIEPHRLRLTASDRHTIATTCTRGTDSDGTWSGRIAPGRIEQLRTSLTRLPDFECAAPITLIGHGEHLTIAGPEETVQIPTTAVAPPEAVRTALAAATTPTTIPAVGMHIGPQLLSRFAAMAGPDPVYLHLADNPAAANSARSAHMLVLASRTALGLAPMHGGDQAAEDIAELWAELHHIPETALAAPEQACPEHFAGALVCTLAAGHDGKHRHTTGRTWWWDD
jgi:hypothetical protein